MRHDFSAFSSRRIRSRQEQLEADVQRAWADDPVIASKMAGTKQAQSSKGRVK